MGIRTSRCFCSAASLDRADAVALLRSEILAPLLALSGDDTLEAKHLIQSLKAALKRGPSAMAVAAICLSSSWKVPAEKLTVEAVVEMFERSFDMRKRFDGRVSVAAACSSETFKDWSAATRFNPTSAVDDCDTQQRLDNFNSFDELSRLCERGGAQSAICLLRSAWLQEQWAKAQRTGDPFVLPSRNVLPADAAYQGPISMDRVFIVVLSYCWAGPGEPDRTTLCFRTCVRCLRTWTRRVILMVSRS